MQEARKPDRAARLTSRSGVTSYIQSMAEETSLLELVELAKIQGVAQSKIAEALGSETNEAKNMLRQLTKEKKDTRVDAYITKGWGSLLRDAAAQGIAPQEYLSDELDSADARLKKLARCLAELAERDGSEDLPDELGTYAWGMHSTLETNSSTYLHVAHALNVIGIILTFAIVLCAVLYQEHGIQELEIRYIDAQAEILNISNGVRRLAESVGTDAANAEERINGENKALPNWKWFKTLNTILPLVVGALIAFDGWWANQNRTHKEQKIHVCDCRLEASTESVRPAQVQAGEQMGQNYGSQAQY